MQSCEIKGLSVFSIADGKEIGRVRDLLINGEKKSVDYLLIDTPNWHLASYVIPFQQAAGIGADAVMVGAESILRRLNEDQEGIKLVERGVRLVGSRVLTQKGRLIGRISEYHVDENTGEIIGCELVDGSDQARGIIPSKAALTFGKDALVVGNDIETQLWSSINEFQDNGVKDNQPEETAKAPEKTVELFEQKQREYLLGKVTRTDVCDANGNVLVAKGETVTAELLDKVVMADRLKELMLGI